MSQPRPHKSVNTHMRTIECQPSIISLWCRRCSLRRGRVRCGGTKEMTCRQTRQRLASSLWCRRRSLRRRGRVRCGGTKEMTCRRTRQRLASSLWCRRLSLRRRGRVRFGAGRRERAGRAAGRGRRRWRRRRRRCATIPKRWRVRQMREGLGHLFGAAPLVLVGRWRRDRRDGMQVDERGLDHLFGAAPLVASHPRAEWSSPFQ